MDQVTLTRATVQQSLHVATAAAYPVALIATLRAALEQKPKFTLSCGCPSQYGGAPAEWPKTDREGNPAVAYGVVCERHWHEYEARCPNCASLEAQNTELDRKLASLEQPKPPPEAQTEAERLAYCAGWWAAMEAKAKQDVPEMVTPEQENPTRQMPEWMDYDQATDVLTIHGRRYSAAMFGERGFLSPAGTLLQVAEGQPDSVTLMTILPTEPK
jgi:hypothetical protein